MKKRIISAALSLCVGFSAVSAMPIRAQAAGDEQIEAAEALYQYGLFYGKGELPNGMPNFDLDAQSTRGEAVTMLVRLLGKQEEAKQNYPVSHFTDAGWATPYIAYAYSNNITNGVSDTLFGLDEPINQSQFVTLVLRTLGYTDVYWRNPYPTADEVGLYYNEQSCLRGDMVRICESALRCTVADEYDILYNILDAQGVIQNIPMPTPKVVAGPVTQQINEIWVNSGDELVNQLYPVVQGRTPHLTVYVPAGQSISYFNFLYNNSDLINRYTDLQHWAYGSYSADSITFDFAYNDAVATMAYWEGKNTAPVDAVYQLSQRAKEVHSSLVDGSMSEYDRVLAYHDWLVNFNTYQETGDSSHSAVGALIDGRAVCEGYAEAFDLLCYLGGIECLQVTGDSKGVPHSWNKVKIDGNWYNIDVTWDDPVSSQPIMRHDYFLISDDKLSADHSWKLYPWLPAAPNNW